MLAKLTKENPDCVIVDSGNLTNTTDKLELIAGLMSAWKCDAVGVGILDLAIPDFFGRVAYTRSFNSPTNLDADERVWLVCEGVDGAAEFFLNGTPILNLPKPDLPGGCDVTALLRPHNLLSVEVSLFPPGHAEHVPRALGCAGRGRGIVGEVRLEIRRGTSSR